MTVRRILAPGWMERRERPVAVFRVKGKTVEIFTATYDEAEELILAAGARAVDEADPGAEKTVAAFYADGDKFLSRLAQLGFPEYEFLRDTDPDAPRSFSLSPMSVSGWTQSHREEVATRLAHRLHTATPRVELEDVLALFDWNPASGIEVVKEFTRLREIQAVRVAELMARRPIRPGGQVRYGRPPKNQLTPAPTPRAVNA